MGAGEETRLVRNAKKIALLLMGVAYQKYLTELEKQQEVLTGISGHDDGRLRDGVGAAAVAKAGGAGKGALAADMLPVFLRDAMARIEIAGADGAGAHARKATRCATNMAVLRRFAKYEPVDAIALRRKIAGRLLEAERYLV